MRPRAAFALFAPALLWACADDEPACGRLPDCDIREQACEQRILAIAACLRGGDADEVAIRVVDFDAYVDEQIAQVGGLPPERRMRREQMYAGLALLDLAPAGLTLEAAVEQDLDWVGAFYSDDEREIVILDRGAPLDGLSAAGLLLHELVHALQDAAHDFDVLYDRQSLGGDGASAVSALIEGEAVIHTDRALADAFGYAPAQVDWDDLYRRYEEQGSRTLARSPSPLIAVDSWFVYAFGARYVNAAFERGGSDEVLALFDDPPSSARAIALGFGRAEPDRGAWIEPEIDARALPPAPEGFALVAQLHLGAYLAHLFATRPDPELARAPLEHSASDRLRADVLTVQASADGELLVSWRLRFSEPEHAERFLASLARPRLPDAAWVEERDAIVIAATEPALVEAALEPTAWRALPGDEQAAATAATHARLLCRAPPPCATADNAARARRGAPRGVHEP